METTHRTLNEECDPYATGHKADYYQVLPLPPQPESTTSASDGATEWVVSSTPSKEKRTPQKHRQYWAVMKAVIGQGGMIRSKRGLLRLMDEIEEWVG